MRRLYVYIYMCMEYTYINVSIYVYNSMMFLFPCLLINISIVILIFILMYLLTSLSIYRLMCVCMYRHMYMPERDTIRPGDSGYEAMLAPPWLRHRLCGVASLSSVCLFTTGVPYIRCQPPAPPPPHLKAVKVNIAYRGEALSETILLEAENMVDHVLHPVKPGSKTADDLEEPFGPLVKDIEKLKGECAELVKSFKKSLDDWESALGAGLKGEATEDSAKENLRDLEKDFKGDGKAVKQVAGRFVFIGWAVGVRQLCPPQLNLNAGRLVHLAQELVRPRALLGCVRCEGLQG